MTMRLNHFFLTCGMLFAISISAATAAPARGGLAALVELLGKSSDDGLREDLLDGILRGFSGRRSIAMPSEWPGVYAKLQASSSQAVRDRSLELALIFDDPVALRTLRRRASDLETAPAVRRRSLAALVGKKPADLAPLLLQLAADPATRSIAVRGLAGYNHPATAATLLELYPSFPSAARQDAVQTLASRPSWARRLLSAVERGGIPRAALTAYTARQLRNLEDEEITARVRALWGRVRTSPAEKVKLIATYKNRLSPESLQRGSPPAGRVIYQQACANCHSLFGSGGKIGPDLTGAQRTNLDYLLENLLDPSATVAKAYQLQVIATVSGRVITGLVVAETRKSVTIQTVNEKLTVPAGEIETRTRSPVSMMPEGILQKLSTQQLRDLMAYLVGTTQVPLPDDRAAD